MNPLGPSHCKLIRNRDRLQPGIDGPLQRMLRHDLSGLKACDDIERVPHNVHKLGVGVYRAEEQHPVDILRRLIKPTPTGDPLSLKKESGITILQHTSAGRLFQ